MKSSWDVETIETPSAELWVCQDLPDSDRRWHVRAARETMSPPWDDSRHRQWDDEFNEIESSLSRLLTTTESESSEWELTDESRDALGESFSLHRDSIRRLASAYYRATGNVSHACDWLESEVYTHAIDAIGAGKLGVPTTRRDWLALARVVRNRYWDYASLSVGRGDSRLLFELLSDEDTNVQTRINAMHDRLDPEAFAVQLAELYSAGAGRLPEWAVETIATLVELPNGSRREYAEHCGIKIASWVSRVKRLKTGIRAAV